MSIKIQTQNSLFRFRNLKWLLGSVLLHVVIIAGLLFSGALESNAPESGKVTKRVAPKQKRRELRQSQPIPKEHARLLKKEAQFAKRKEVIRRVERMKENLRKMDRAREVRANQISNRSQKEIASDLIARIRVGARTFAFESKQRYGGPERVKLRGLADETEASAEALFESPDATELRARMVASTYVAHTKAKSNAEQPINKSIGSSSLGLPEDKHVFNLADILKQLVDRLQDEEAMNAATLNELSSMPDQPEMENRNTAELSSSELYQLARELEKQLVERFNEIQALEKAIDETTSFAEAQRNSDSLKLPARPDISGQLERAAETIGDVNRFRTAITTMSNQLKDMELRSQSLVGQVAGTETADIGDAAKARRLQNALNLAASQSTNGSVDLSNAMRALAQFDGHGSGTAADSEFYLEGEGGNRMAKLDAHRGIRLPKEMLLAQALPARRFSRAAARKGWLYIDTWYMIGPWDNGGAVVYSRPHPPENVVDFDALYAGGKNGQQLSWEFYQSNNIRIIPPNSERDATYYFYTEMEFDEGIDLYVAIASDDATKVWLNDQIIWQENGLSQWRIGEGLRKVFFKPGTNKILVRLENGPGETMFSMLMCPKAAVEKLQ